MYLISIYFDAETDKRIRTYINSIANATGNTAMLDGTVPPHITVAAFHADSEKLAKEIFENGTRGLGQGEVQWVSCGSFLPGVIYAAPVLNVYLQNLVETYYKELILKEGVRIDGRYQPFCWFPHTTLGKHLTAEELREAFASMQTCFGPFCGKVTKIGLAKTNPYTDLEVLNLL